MALLLEALDSLVEALCCRRELQTQVSQPLVRELVWLFSRTLLVLASAHHQYRFVFLILDISNRIVAMEYYYHHLI